jgi:hypothetical protein
MMNEIKWTLWDYLGLLGEESALIWTIIPLSKRTWLINWLV